MAKHPPAPLLPDGLRRIPLAHRALHDIDAGRPENGMAAVQAAISAGYGIEIDLQLSGDGRAMVFHDATLERTATGSGRVHDWTAAELSGVPLRGGGGEGIPTLEEVLQAVNGRVPLLIEIKDQAHGGSRAGIGPLEAATALALADWSDAADWVAVMSFNPAAVAQMARIAPHLPRGLTTFAWDAAEAAHMPAARLDRLRAIADFDSIGAVFISHDHQDLGRPRVLALRAAGVPVLCWTIKDPAAEAVARLGADNITFEGYLPGIPASAAT